MIRGGEGAARYWPIVFAGIVCGLLALGGYRISHIPVYEYYNVKVLKQYDAYNWLMEKDDGQFHYRGCSDFPNDKVIWAGYVARKIRYEEFGNCKSILRSDLGFWWDRDEQTGNVKEIR